MQAESLETPVWWMRVIFGRHPRRTLIRLTLLVALTIVLFKFFILPIQVSGRSMEPTYAHGRVNFVNQLAYVWAKPKRGDIVAIRVPGERDMLLKRIVALPGEHVSMKRGEIYIDGEPIEEPYIRRWKRGLDFEERAVEPDHYYMVGDNRGLSVYFQVPVWQIVGKVIF
jgi:signal peptidase I